MGGLSLLAPVSFFHSDCGLVHAVSKGHPVQQFASTSRTPPPTPPQPFPSSGLGGATYRMRNVASSHPWCCRQNVTNPTGDWHSTPSLSVCLSHHSADGKCPVCSMDLYMTYIGPWSALWVRVQELCESRGGRPGLPVLTNLMVSVDVKLY